MKYILVLVRSRSKKETANSNGKEYGSNGNSKEAWPSLGSSPPADSPARKQTSPKPHHSTGNTHIRKSSNINIEVFFNSYYLVFQLKYKKTARQNHPVRHSNKYNSLKRNTTKKITQNQKRTELTKK